MGIEGALWTLPVATGLMLSPWIAMIGARVDLGDRLAAWGLFLSPGDRQSRRTRNTPSVLDAWQPIFHPLAERQLPEG